jgi:hypothetical protein
MIRRRLYELAGTLIIGDGFAFLFAPRPHMLIWVDALKPSLWRHSVRWFADHDLAGRVIGIVEIALGSWIVAQAYRDVK